MNKCTRCSELKSDTSIHCKRVNKDGSIYIRYICRECRRGRYARKTIEQRVITLPPEKPNYRSFYLNPQTSWKKVNVVKPIKIKYTAPQEEIVRLGMEKNLSIMRKYA